MERLKDLAGLLVQEKMAVYPALLLIGSGHNLWEEVLLNPSILWTTYPGIRIYWIGWPLILFATIMILKGNISDFNV